MDQTQKNCSLNKEVNIKSDIIPLSSLNSLPLKTKTSKIKILKNP